MNIYSLSYERNHVFNDFLIWRKNFRKFRSFSLGFLAACDKDTNQVSTDQAWIAVYRTEFHNELCARSLIPTVGDGEQI